MKAAGIIAEYNPYHQGHEWQIKEFKKLYPDHLLIVLCTDAFSSRGIPSLMKLEDKARLAIEAGADLVLRFPAVYAMQAADRFAMYGLEALKAAGIEKLCFSSETQDPIMLENLAALDLSKKDPSRSLNRLYDSLDLKPGPNDILGAQYIKWASHFGIEPVILKRQQQMISATQSRKNFFQGQPVDHDELFVQNADMEVFYPFIKARLLTASPEELSKILMVDEGIENRLIQAARKADTWKEYVELAKCKSYTRVRIARVSMMILLNVSRSDFKRHDSFFALIPAAMSSAGRKWLSTLPKGSELISRTKDLPDFLKSCLFKEREIYNLALQPEKRLPLLDPVRLVNTLNTVD